MSYSQTQTTTSQTTAGPLPPPPADTADPAIYEEEGLEDGDGDEILRRVQEEVFSHKLGQSPRLEVWVLNLG
ncbi:hypothetical protein EV359DRAFT_85584 [Lentinula novae-zelandiae]|nr:hypothetical protein EV359DRAFT_85584 [Lentinula novae-zelandiae]